MKKLYILCEGLTEKIFVRNILEPYLNLQGIYEIDAMIFKTSSYSYGKTHRGGVSNYNQAIEELKNLCYGNEPAIVTSFIDYYGLKNIPNVSYNGTDKYILLSEIEEQMRQDVGSEKFIPYLSLHEFEGLLFSSPEQFSDYFGNPRGLNARLNKILQDFNYNPELINDSKDTAPSKRIEALKPSYISSYRKEIDGNIIAKNITINVIKQKCKHFSDWVDKIIKACQQ